MIKELFRCGLLLSMLLGCVLQSFPYQHSDEEHVEVSMRMVGHQVLLHTGDSTSLVLPVTKNGDQYQIRFGAEFEFSPDSIAFVIDSVIEATDISKNYVVEFVSCEPELIVHSYEVGAVQDVLACRGRDMPLGLYYPARRQRSSGRNFRAHGGS